jgi:rhodanese-related sulfurtransferase
MMKRTVNTTSFGWVLVLLAVSLVASGCSEANESGVTEISQQELMSSPPADALILDVRTQEEFSSGHVPGAVNIPHDELALRLSDLDSETDRPVIVYCRSGKRAGLASTVLLDAGYTNVLHLDGDMNGWQASGLPTE